MKRDRKPPNQLAVDHEAANAATRRELVEGLLMSTIARVFRSGPEIERQVGHITVQGNLKRVTIASRGEVWWVGLLLEYMRRNYPSYKVSLLGQRRRNDRLTVVTLLVSELIELDRTHPHVALHNYRQTMPDGFVQVRIVPNGRTPM